MEILINLLKSSALLGLFFMIYYVFLRTDTLYQFKRFYFYSGLIFSTILPWIYFTKTVIIEKTSSAPIFVSQANLPQAVTETTSLPIETSIDWYQVMFYVYLVITVVVLLWYLMRYFKIFLELNRSQFEDKSTYKLHIISNEIGPFSFFKHIVINREDYESDNYNFILAHEATHSKEWHSLDVLITNIACALFWFNPVMWMYRKHWLQNLEHIADQAATKNTDKTAYQYLLLNSVLGQPNVQMVTTTFFQPSIKQRIMMLNKPKTPKIFTMKGLLIIPVLVMFMINFQVEIIAQEQKTNQKSFSFNSFGQIDETLLKLNTSEKRDPFDVSNYTQAPTFIDNQMFVKDSLKKSTKVVIKITKDASQTYLNGTKSFLKDKFGIDIKYEDIEFNEKGEITSINVEVDCNDGFGGATAIKGEKPISNIIIYRDYSKDTNSPFGVVDEVYYNDITNQQVFGGEKIMMEPGPRNQKASEYSVISNLSNIKYKDDNENSETRLKAETSSNSVSLENIKKYIINSKSYERSELTKRILIVDKYNIIDDETIEIEGKFKDDLFETKLGLGEKIHLGDINIIFFHQGDKAEFTEMKEVSIQKTRSMESIKSDDSIDSYKLVAITDRLSVDFEKVETFIVSGISYSKNVFKNHNILVEKYSFDSDKVLKIKGELIHKDRFFLKLISFGVIDSKGQLLRPIDYIAYDENNKPDLFKLKDIKKSN